MLVTADKAYSSRAIRAHLRRRGIRAVIPTIYQAALTIAAITQWA